MQIMIIVVMSCQVNKHGLVRLNLGVLLLLLLVEVHRLVDLLGWGFVATAAFLPTLGDVWVRDTQSCLCCQ